ncbi:MAG: cupin domain-containing protein [Desulfuromonadales bacterium]|nr:cupin domain-containing protein [Desulfuromonadales bacterium]
MNAVAGHLFKAVPAKLAEELFDVLVSAENVRIERIVSRGHASPHDFWYDQEQHEFVLLVSGRARLAFADGSPSRELAAGDWLVLPAHQRHRVDWTDPEQETVWLAVHYGPRNHT